jgi:site-specific recombinase XerD
MLDNLTLRPQYVGMQLHAALDAFLLSRQAMRCTAKTMEHYEYTLGAFIGYLDGAGVEYVGDVTAGHIRAYLVGLQKRGLRDTTQHAHARGIKTWLRWLVNEGDIQDTPMRRVAMPRLEQRVPAPFSPDDVQTLLAACDRATVTGSRDYAIILALLDTGLRASELVSLQIGDIDMRSGLCSVMGKGGKMRQVRVGARARQAILRMLSYRSGIEPGAPLWMAYSVNAAERGGLSRSGLQTLLHRLGRDTGVRPCSPHRFRRTFALWCLRDGMDLHSLRLLMGHSNLVVLQRYLALAGEDVERAHIAHSPVDRLLSR